MKNIDIISYLKIYGGFLIIMPMIYMFFDRYENNPLMISIIIYVCTCLVGTVMFNYLETGNILKFSKK